MELLTILGWFGGNEILVIGIVLLLLFGGKKIPELMRGLGSGIKEFKDSVKEDDKKTDSKSETNANS